MHWQYNGLQNNHARCCYDYNGHVIGRISRSPVCPTTSIDKATTDLRLLVIRLTFSATVLNAVYLEVVVLFYRSISAYQDLS